MTTSEPVVVDLRGPEDAFIGDTGLASRLATRQLESPRGTKEWRVVRQDGIETFLSPSDPPTAYVRARSDEEADVIIHFTRITPLPDLRLRLREHSVTIKKAERRARRERRELRARGYDVPEPDKETP